MAFLAYCTPKKFDADPPQEIHVSEAVASCLTTKQLARAATIVDQKVGEVDWDVGVSSRPIVHTTRFPFWTGRAERVETREGDDVFYAQIQRGRRTIWGRFVRGRKGPMSRSQTVILRPVSDVGAVGWRAVAAYVGEPAPPFPGDPFATSASRGFWSRHALVDGAVPYNRQTVTTVCPWGSPVTNAT